jgi:small-conductance mechanosensitive channel
MNTHQNILLQIFEEFEKEDIAFAYPTQTVFLEPQATDATDTPPKK